MLGEIATNTEAVSNTSTISFGVGGSPTQVWSATLGGVLAGCLVGINSGGTGQVTASATKMFGGGYVITAGADVTLACVASITGQVGWSLRYRPLAPGAYVVAAV